MRQRSVWFFTDREEEFVNLLIQVGMRKYVANMLVFLANTTEATSREIERGTDMRQPEVSMAIKYLLAHEWIKSREIPSEQKGRPQKIYTLAVPVKTILASVEKEKTTEAKHKLALIKKIRDYV